MIQSAYHIKEVESREKKQLVEAKRLDLRFRQGSKGSDLEIDMVCLKIKC